MTDLSDLRSWLFKGLAVEGVLGKLEADGVSVRAASDPGALQRVLPLEDFSSDIRERAMGALPAYLAFFCIENAVRELVNERMTQQHGSGWWEQHVAKAIKDRVQTRRQKEGENRWHARRGDHELSYTDFGDLALIRSLNSPSLRCVHL